MPDASESDSAQRILELATEHGMLTSDQLSTLVVAKGECATDVAIQKQLLTVAQIDLLKPLSEPNTFLNGYEFLAVIGEGATGTVYRARQTHLNRTVAIKLLKLSAMENHTATARSHIEAQLGAQLRHPNIVAVLDYGVQQGRVYLAMECVEGESILELIERKGRLDRVMAMQLAKQAVSALAHAADHDIVHRDIKPANLMLTDHQPGLTLPANVPAVKVSDFGLAFQAQNSDATRLTVDGAALGTPSYVAPEQLQDSSVDHRADIYALGATLYHMVTGQQPFANSNALHAIATKLMGDEAWRNNIADDICADLKQLILEMTAHDPDDRIQDYATLAVRVDAILQATSDNIVVSQPAVSQNVTADGGGDSSVTTAARPSPVRRRRLLLATIVLCAATALLSAASGYLAVPALVQLPTEPTRNQQFLFDGFTVPFGLQSKEWIPTEDAEGGYVLSGTDGFKRLKVPLFDAEPADYFQFRLEINPLQTASADVCFAVNRSGDCSVLRITATGVEVGTGTTDDTGLQSFDPPKNRSRSATAGTPANLNVQVERQVGGWFINVDGKRLAAVPAGEGDSEYVYLRANNGTAHFSNIQVLQTQPVSQ